MMPLSIRRPHRVENSRRGLSRRGRALRGVIIGASLFIIGQLTFGLHAESEPRRKDPTYGDKYDKLATRADARPLALVLGSSRTLLGFKADDVERDLPGLRAFNFGTPASGPITLLIYLKRLLKAGIIPALLILEILPPTLADGPDGPPEQTFLTGERLSYSEVKLAERFGFRPEPLECAWRESVYSPATALRFQLIGRVMPSLLPWNLRSDWSRNTDANGWTTPPRQSVTDEERAERSASAAREYRSTVNALSVDGRPLQALAELLELCHERGIAATVLRMPESETFRAIYPPGSIERIGDLLNSASREHRATFVDANCWLEEADFYDGHHLFRSGAERFTRRLNNEVIRPHFGGGK